MDILISLTFLNLFVPLVYRITPQNVYERMAFGYAFYLVIMYYLLTAVFLTRKNERKNEAHAFININLFLIPILIGAGLQFMFYGLSVAWLASALGLVGLHMMQQNEIAYVDPLVETYNRQYLNFILSAWISRGLRFSGAMIDIDRFKSINDRFGHSEGDFALQAVARILKKSRTDNEWVFRFAGGEFIVLKPSSSKDALTPYFSQVEKYLDAFNRLNSNYSISLSCCCSPEMSRACSLRLSIDGFVHLYRQKNRFRWGCQGRRAFILALADQMNRI